MLVVDASILVVALADGTDGASARARSRGEHLAAAEPPDLEVASVLRRQIKTGWVGLRRADLALVDLRASRFG